VACVTTGGSRAVAVVLAAATEAVAAADYPLPRVARITTGGSRAVAAAAAVAVAAAWDARMMR
jgi:hypothetical protein